MHYAIPCVVWPIGLWATNPTPGTRCQGVTCQHVQQGRHGVIAGVSASVVRIHPLLLIIH